jgi:TATA-box binding protein (TBP) (component of TFIID and TFIIIB)
MNLLLYVTQSVAIADTHNEAFVPVMLWHSGMLVVTGRAQHREQLKATLEDMAKKLVVDWAAAQR